MTDILIVGGGAAGLTAACAAAQSGAQTTLLEGGDRVGRKILASGNGRCNLINTGAPCYFGDAAFAREVLSACGEEDIRAFFEEAGLRINPLPEEDGRVYPATGQAASVVDALRARAARLGVQILCERPVTRIEPLADGSFRVTAGGAALSARRVIAAFGSPAGGRKLGADSYALLTALSHRLIPPVPALTPILCDMRAYAALRGLRVPAAVTLFSDGRPLERAGGEILFSDSGVSGVCAMQLGRAAGESVRAGVPTQLRLDFSPLLALAPRTHFHETNPLDDSAARIEILLTYLKERARTLSGKDFLTGLVPRVLAEALTRPEKGDTPLPALARRLAAFPLTATGVREMDSAQVAHGGLDTKDFSPRTMESRHVRGLYCAGEALNVDGDCGGFNLMFAWAAGLTAGRAAARSLTSQP